VTGLVQQLVVAGLASAVALCGVIMIIADTGPWMTSALRVYTFIGSCLLLFGFVLGARALALTFRDQHLRGSARRD
jgi:ubiquinone biosynthesis protein